MLACGRRANERAVGQGVAGQGATHTRWFSHRCAADPFFQATFSLVPTLLQLELLFQQVCEQKQAQRQQQREQAQQEQEREKEQEQEQEQEQQAAEEQQHGAQAGQAAPQVGGVARSFSAVCTLSFQRDGSYCWLQWVTLCCRSHRFGPHCILAVGESLASSSQLFLCASSCFPDAPSPLAPCLQSSGRGSKRTATAEYSAGLWKRQLTDCGLKEKRTNFSGAHSSSWPHAALLGCLRMLQCRQALLPDLLPC